MRKSVGPKQFPSSTFSMIMYAILEIEHAEQTSGANLSQILEYIELTFEISKKESIVYEIKKRIEKNYLVYHKDTQKYTINWDSKDKVEKSPRKSEKKSLKKADEKSPKKIDSNKKGKKRALEKEESSEESSEEDIKPQKKKTKNEYSEQFVKRKNNKNSPVRCPFDWVEVQKQKG